MKDRWLSPPWLDIMSSSKITKKCTLTTKRIDGFNIQGNKISKEEPLECYYCGCDDILGIEIIGIAIDEPIIWECKHCHEHMLKYSRAKTEKLLQGAPEIDITKEEWEEAWAKGPN